MHEDKHDDDSLQSRILKWKLVRGILQYREYAREHSRSRRWIKAGLFLGAAIVILLRGILSPHLTASTDTPFGQFNDIGSGNLSVEMVSAKYSPKQQRMIIDFKTKGNSGDAVVLPEQLKFQVAIAAASGNVEEDVIPTTLNHFTVILDKLAPGFRGVRTTVEQNPKYITSDDATTDLDASSSSSSSSKANGAKFIINETKKIKVASVPVLSPKEYALHAVLDDITDKQKAINNSEVAIKQAKVTIKIDGQKVVDQRKEEKYQTGSARDDTEQTITSIEGDKTANEGNIVKEQKKIAKLQREILLLHNKIDDIKSGRYEIQNTKSN